MTWKRYACHVRNSRETSSQSAVFGPLWANKASNQRIGLDLELGCQSARLIFRLSFSGFVLNKRHNGKFRVLLHVTCVVVIIIKTASLV